jgi:protein Mpv17
LWIHKTQTHIGQQRQEKQRVCLIYFRLVQESFIISNSLHPSIIDKPEVGSKIQGYHFIIMPLTARPIISAWVIVINLLLASTKAFQQQAIPSLLPRLRHAGPTHRRNEVPFGSTTSQDRVPLDRTTNLSSSLWTTVDTLWKMNPYAAGAFVCGIKACSADFFAQQRQIRMRHFHDKSDVFDQQQRQQPPKFVQEIDMKRNLAFLLYGVIYQGLGQELIYNHLYPLMFGTGVDVRTVALKVMFDLFIQTTFLTLPIAYYAKSVVFGRPVKYAIQQYVDDIKNKGLLTKYFLLWGPVQSLTFSIIPEHFRITFIACVSFFWVIILSSLSSAGNRDNVVVTPVMEDTDTSGMQ